MSQIFKTNFFIFLKQIKNMNKSQFTEWNERMFKKYYTEKQYYHPNSLIRYTENKRVNLALKFLELKEDDKILSVGCGEGYLLNKIDKGEVWGIDLSGEAIKRAKEKLKNKKNMNLLVADASEMPFKEKSFDKVECSEVVEHVLDPRKLIKEITRVSGDQAIIVFTIPNEDLINRIKRALSSLHLFSLLLKDIPKKQEWHLHNLNYKNFLSIINRVLSIEKKQAVPFNWFPVRYVIKCKKII